MAIEHSEFTDLGPAWFHAQGEPIPPQRAGKFVQLLTDSGTSEHLVLSPKRQSAYHADIASLFLSDRGVGGTWNRQHDSWEMDLDAGWVIRGGGYFGLEEPNCALRLYGHSIAYGRYDPTGLGARLEALVALNGWTILTE